MFMPLLLTSTCLFLLPTGFMGQVRFVQEIAIRQQLEAGNIVLLTNVGVSASGELLNCNVYDVSWSFEQGCLA